MQREASATGGTLHGAAFQTQPEMYWISGSS